MPKDTPLDVADRLHGALAKILQSAEVGEQLTRLGAEAGGNPRPAFTALVRAESERWGRIIRDKSIKPE